MFALLVTNAIFLIGVYVSCTISGDISAFILPVQVLLLFETIANVSLYSGMAYKLKNFLRENFNTRFDRDL